MIAVFFAVTFIIAYNLSHYISPLFLWIWVGLVLFYLFSGLIEKGNKK